MKISGIIGGISGLAAAFIAENKVFELCSPNRNNLCFIEFD